MYRYAINLSLIEEIVFEYCSLYSQNTTLRNNFGSIWKFCAPSFWHHDQLWINCFFFFFFLLINVKGSKVSPISVFPCVCKCGFICYLCFSLQLLKIIYLNSKLWIFYMIFFWILSLQLRVSSSFSIKLSSQYCYLISPVIIINADISFPVK